MRLLARVPVHDRSQVSEVRRLATHFAQKLGFDEQEIGRVAIVATETGNNLVNHAREGHVLLSTLAASLQMVAVDRGPGMNVERCLEDGFSTFGTPGTGLGAIRRQSGSFDAHSSPAGTVIVSTFGKAPSRYGAVRAPIKGETACGDAWSLVERDDTTWIMVADGLGHGEFAAAAADQAVTAFESSRFRDPASVVEDIHRALRSTRGAAVAVAEVRGTAVRYCGLGNISAVLYNGAANVHMVSLNGTAGVEARKFGQFSYVWNPGALLIMHSDGLQSQWGLERYPAIVRQHPAVIAGVLYRDYTRDRDDVTVLVVRQ